MPADAPDPLASLDPSARRAPARVRVAVGAAIVCFVAAVAVSAVLSASAAGDRGAVDGAAPPAGGASVEDAPAEVGVSRSRPVLVHVLGAVAEPGLVELGEGARVVDAIAAAGGFSADADQGGVNLARPVADGEQLVVPRVGEVPPPLPAGASGAGGAGGADGLVHLNTADAAALDTLPRIGPALAQRILDWRESNGGFTSVDQLREVAGIGDATFAGLVDLVAL